MPPHLTYATVDETDRIVIREARSSNGETRWFYIECYNGEDCLTALCIFPTRQSVPVPITFEPYHPDPIDLTASSAPQDPITTLDTDPAP